MPSLADRKQSRSEELLEFIFSGPFAGILSDMPPSRIEKYGGFLDLLNVIMKNGRVTVRPGFTGLTLLPAPNEPIIGVGDFFNNAGLRKQVVWTPTRMFSWNGVADTWTQIFGVLHGTVDNYMDWAVVNYQILFSQGVDPVQRWDGNAGNFSVASPNAVPAKYMMELSTYLVVANTIEAGTPFPQRIRWTAPGDTTDWTSLSAGVRDEISDLGPINHLVKLYQQGYAIHQFGFTQIIPTGNGLNPFNFVPITSNNHGTVYANSVGHQGGEVACYVGMDNVYLFDGTNAIAIGDRPTQDGYKVGARTRILADCQVVVPTKVLGYISTFVGTTYYNAYWLIIPGVAVWCYNFDEQNWTRFSYTQIISAIGRFSRGGIPRIMDLVGPIFAQNWSPATLAPTKPLDGLLLGFTDGTPAYVDFTNYSEQPWSISSGQCVFNDLRHQHNVKKYRITILDKGQVTFSVTLTGIVYPVVNPVLDANGNPISTNSTQSTQTQIITMGNGSGQEISRVIEFAIPGQYITWQINGPAGSSASFVEFTPIYDTGGEQRGG